MKSPYNHASNCAQLIRDYVETHGDEIGGPIELAELWSEIEAFAWLRKTDALKEQGK